MLAGKGEKEQGQHQGLIGSLTHSIQVLCWVLGVQWREE
jgi:hypothetical protein